MAKKKASSRKTPAKSTPARKKAARPAPQKSARKAAAKPVVAARSRANAAKAVAEGPVTLEQAKALAQRQAPVSTVLEGVAPAGQAATHATLAGERQKLERQAENENERRIREYKATMEIMQRRGVKGIAPAPAAESVQTEGPSPPVATPSAASGPLRIFAEGDSWFDYPAVTIPFFGGGVVPRLEKKLGLPILNLAKAGDEVRNMLGVEERLILIEQLKKGSPAGGPWDVLLFSGGGNDIVGNPMALWVNDFNAAIPPANLINKARYEAALRLVQAGYEDLITLRDTLSPNTHLVFHGYDFVIPDGRGICGYGPWLKPTFDLRRFPRAAAFDLIRAMLQQFATMLQSLAAGRADITFINTQGTLAPVTGSWHNELHPSKSGFNQIADVFLANLKTLFPGRIP